MIKTFEAIIDTQGRIYPLEAVKFTAPQRVSVTILPKIEESESSGTNGFSIQGLGQVVGDLEAGSREIAEQFNQAIERSGREIQKN